MAKTRVLLADDHAILRAGLALMINAQADMEVAAEAADGLEAVEKARKIKPDVVILDLTMPELSGLRALHRLQEECPESRVLILTMHDDPAYGRSLLAAGALGYVTKKAADRELLLAIRAVREGRHFVDITQAEELLPNARRRNAAHDLLSPREREVLIFLARGFTHREIAEKVNLSIKTIETYLARIGQKLGVRRRAALVQYAMDTGLLHIGDTLR